MRLYKSLFESAADRLLRNASVRSDIKSCDDFRADIITITGNFISLRAHGKNLELAVAASGFPRFSIKIRNPLSNLDLSNEEIKSYIENLILNVAEIFYGLMAIISVSFDTDAEKSRLYIYAEFPKKRYTETQIIANAKKAAESVRP